MVEKLAADDRGYWWYSGRYLWSPELTDALDKFLDRRGASAKQTWGESFESDRITYEMVMRLPESTAEHLLLKHWAHLRFSYPFVQTALYVSTPRLLEAAQSAINECPEPAKLMEHLGYHFGLRIKGRPGLTRETQILALVPYLHLLSPLDLGRLWDTCNDHGWFPIRQEHLDVRLLPPFRQHLWDRDHAALAFDEMAKWQHLVLVGHRIDDLLKTGVMWSEILTTMAAWLDKRRSIEALQIVATAIEHCGSRMDLSALRIYQGMPESAARHLVADTQFAVNRRRIR